MQQSNVLYLTGTHTTAVLPTCAEATNTKSTSPTIQCNQLNIADPRPKLPHPPRLNVLAKHLKGISPSGVIFLGGRNGPTPSTEPTLGTTYFDLRRKNKRASPGVGAQTRLATVLSRRREAIKGCQAGQDLPSRNMSHCSTLSSCTTPQLFRSSTHAVMISLRSHACA